MSAPTCEAWMDWAAFLVLFYWSFRAVQLITSAIVRRRIERSR